jgi:hypothetical protein
MRIALWITKITDTHSEHVILIDFPRQQLLRKRASLLRLYTMLHWPSFYIWRRSLSEGQWRTEGGLGRSNPPRNSEVLTKLSRIPCSVENTSLTV